MLNQLARAILVATSLAPIALVFAVSSWAQHPTRSWVAGGVAILLVAVCLLLLRLVKSEGGKEIVQGEVGKSLDKEILPFLISYSLPLLTTKENGVNLPALCAFTIILGLVLFQAHLLHVNPLLGIMGYRFHEMKAASGVTYLLITKDQKAVGGGAKQVIRISDHVLLEVSQDERTA